MLFKAVATVALFAALATAQQTTVGPKSATVSDGKRTTADRTAQANNMAVSQLLEECQRLNMRLTGTDVPPTGEVVTNNGDSTTVTLVGKCAPA